MTSQPTAIRSPESILVPGTDDRQYRHIVLPHNQLQIILVSDPASEKAAACCNVAVGSLADPPEAQGLAHFLEHMLFMGTEKYPEENQYSSFLNEHGGYSNAYTAQENTVYYFDVNSDHLERALDLFASFFTCPLFGESSTNREINAVDSENSKNLQSDTWRKYQLFKSMSRPDHPYNHFSTGNLETLGKVPESRGTNIRDLMIDFYRKHYSANLMRVGVYGRESLDQLEQWAIEKFSEVPNKEIPRSVYPSDPFGAEQLKKVVEVVPVRDLKSIDIFFPIPATEHLYKSKPVKYLAHLIGHESGGSILSALKAKLLANNLGSYQYESCNDFACFGINIELSDHGVQHVSEVLACVFAYLGMLTRKGAQDWVWQELKDMSDMKFRFLDKIDPADYITRLANRLQYAAPEHVLAADDLLFEKDLEKSMEILQCLTPENCLVFTSLKTFAGKTSLKEQWYGTEHNVRGFSAEELQLWKESFAGESDWSQLVALPEPNPFIPTDFSLREKSEAATAIPQLVCKKLSVSETKEIAPVVDEVVPAEKVEETEPVVNEEENAQEATGEERGEEEGDEGDEGEEEDAGDVAAWDPVLAGKALQVFHKPVDKWNVPKLNVYLSLESVFATCTPWNTVMTDLFQAILKELMNEYSYYADCAGLYYDVSLAKGGLEIFFQGYGHKLPTLVERAATEIFRLAHEPSACSESLFQRVKDRQLRALKNQLFAQPYFHCILGGLLCLEEPRWSTAEKYAALRTATLPGLAIFSSQFLSQAKLDVLVNGNTTSEEAISLSERVNAILQTKPLPFSNEFLRRAVSLFPSPSSEQIVEYVYRQSALNCNPNEVNSALENLYLIGEGAGKVNHFVQEDSDEVGLSETEFHGRLRQEALLELVLQLTKEAAFDQLRTKEQLGYIVFTSAKRVAQNVLVYSMIVQSSHKDPVYLDGRVEEFITTYRQTIAEMTEEKLQTFINAVVEKLLEKPKNLDQETDKFWGEIRQNTYLFDRPALVVEKLKSGDINVQSVLDFYDKFIMSGSQRRTKFFSQFFGKDTKFPPEKASVDSNDKKRIVVIKDHSLFKRRMPLMTVQAYDV